jgi:cobyric acid synthase
MSEHNLREIIISNLNQLTNPQLLIIQEFINEMNSTKITNNEWLDKELLESVNDAKKGKVISATMFKEKYLK